MRARFQNVYGPGEVLGAGRWRGTPATVWRNVTPTFVYRALKGLPLQLDDRGRASRDFIYVDDISSGLLACAEQGTPGDVYNLASGVETTIRELAEKVCRDRREAPPLDLGAATAWDHSGPSFRLKREGQRGSSGSRSTPLDEASKHGRVDEAELPYIDRCIERHAAKLAAAGVPLTAEATG